MEPVVGFPGLRVLVIDHDLSWLNTLEKMLNKCKYQVTKCDSAGAALQLLLQRKYGFDIVMCDLNIPHIDGFKFLHHITMEMNLAVILMSTDGEVSNVIKGLQHGACDYLVKPIKLKEIRKIWRHVFKTTKVNESNEETQKFQILRYDEIEANEAGQAMKQVKKKHHERATSKASCSSKKTRVLWNAELHLKFVEAVNQIGVEVARPKKILDLMGVPWLRREHVASHLQKYRMLLSRIELENKMKAGTGEYRAESSITGIIEAAPTLDFNFDDFVVSPIDLGAAVFHDIRHESFLEDDTLNNNEWIWNQGFSDCVDDIADEEIVNYNVQGLLGDAPAQFMKSFDV